MQALDTISEEQRHAVWLVDSGQQVTPHSTGFVLNIEVGTDYGRPLRALMEVQIQEPGG